MALSESEGASLEQLRSMSQQAGLGMSDRELEELKPLYDLYLEYIRKVHSIDLQAEEIGVAFHPDWPSA